MSGEITGNILEEAITLLTNGDFELSRINTDEALVYTIYVERSEYGKICGAKGKMIRSIKYLWETCMSRKLKKPIRVILKEPSSGYSKGRQPIVPEELFDASMFYDVISDILSASADADLSVKEFGDNRTKIFTYTVGEYKEQSYLGQDFKQSFETLATAIAKANGGNVIINF